MIKLILKVNFFVIIISLLVSFNIGAQSYIDRLPTQIVNQLKSMTPEQQIEFARINNIDLPSAGDQPENYNKLGMKGEPLEKLFVDRGDTESAIFFDTFSPSIKEKPERFGLSFFSQEISTFSPVDDVLVPDNYVLGVGDTLVMQMMGTSTGRYDLEIARDGTIFIESLGVISIAGLSLNQAVELIESRVANELFGTRVSINLGKLKAMNIFLAGEVRYPGMYSVSSLATITQSLYQAGGISKLGSLRNIQILRNGKNINTFDAYDLLIKGDSTNDIRLKSGDVVLVPPYKSIAEVRGESRRPMLYETISGETLGDLINMSSGFSENASITETVLLTKKGAGLPQRAITLNLLEESDLNTLIGINDILIIPKANISPRNYVEISGAAHRTGLIGWHKGMSLKDIVGDARKDFPDYIDLDFSLIVRKPDPFSNMTFLNFSLRDLFQDGGYGDIELLEYDHILFFSSTPEMIDPVDLNAEINNPNSSLNTQMISTTNFVNNTFLENEEDPLFSNKMLSKASEDFTRSSLMKPFIELIKLESSSQNLSRLVSIMGAVKHPGIYPLFEGASANDLVNAAGGFLQNAYTSSIELRRQRLENMIYNFESLELSADQSAQSLISTKLKPLDHITVRKYSGTDSLKTITLSGEFVFPGVYALSPGESILSVIERAGGFTDNAFVEGSVYLKELVRLSELKRIQEYSNQIKRNFSSSSLTQENTSAAVLDDINSIIELLESVKPSGRVGIDLNSEDMRNFKVGNDDRLFIPSKPSTVSIVGEVNVPNSIEYDEKYSIEDYLRLSGGLTKRAGEDNIYILRANGLTEVLDKSAFRLFGRKPKLKPGDTLIVPINIQYRDSLTNWTQVTQLIYQSMVSIAAVKGL